MISGKMYRMRTVLQVLPAFAEAWLLTSEAQKAVDRMKTGGSDSGLNLTQGRFLRLPFLLAPLPEQHRIVAKIESLFAKLDNGVTALKRAKANLERYRASVLKAAVEGRLTEPWRRENPPEETGEELLERILVERRERWEEEQLAKFEAKGRTPPKNWRSRYKEPVTPDTSGLPELPEGWCWATVGQVARVRSGQTPKGAAALTTSTGEVPWYKVGDMNLPGNESRMWHSRAYFELDSAKALRLRIHPVGTIIFPKRGGAISTNKKRKLTVSACLDLNLMAIVPIDDAKTWLWWWFQSVDLPSLADGSNVPQINNRNILPLCLPLPPASEQAVAVNLMRKLLEASKQSQEVPKRHVRTSVILRQSILKRAFEGRLVPQDPADEPASVLLEHIRGEPQRQDERISTP